MHIMLKSAVLFLTLSFVLFKLYSRYISITIDLPDEEYDFIIVGGGLTGSVIARRLTDNTSFKVLILEAGPEDGYDPFVNIPLLGPLNVGIWNDWKFKSESQSASLHMKTDNVEHLARGKLLGGTSSINFQYYMRGSPSDYDSWESEGNVGWGFGSVLKYFIKSETSNHFYPIDERYHGHEGPLHVTHSEKIGMSDVFLNAAKETGLDYVVDHNAKDIIGAAVIQTSAKRGLRQSASTSYLRSIAHLRRDRLHIVADAHVTKILIKEREDGIKSASGVEFIKNGKTISVNAKREVVLSAGVFGTPQILMLSGIGPAKHLLEHGISVVKDLPGVGSNYQDHMFAPVYFHAKNLSFGDTAGIKEILYNFPGWLWKGSGPLGNTGGVFANLKFDKLERKTPDFQAIVIPAEADTFLFRLLISNYLYKDNIFEEEIERAKRERNGVLFSFLIHSVLLHPKSKGTVGLRSSSPFSKPKINPNVHSHPDDLEIMIKGMKWISNLTTTAAFRKIGAEVVPLVSKCRKEKPGSYAFNKCLATGEAMLFHGCCSAKMGRFEDTEAVVDPQLRVYGVDRLRIADASIMPHQISAAPQATCYMIGEKAADLIKESNP
ncbi:L-sorbose 1-dehydrogenase-like isoform X2 [Styela clava]